MAELTTLDKAKERLLQDEDQNRYPLLRLAQGGVGECWMSGGSVCLRDQDHDKYMYAVQTANELRDLYEMVSRREGELVSLVTDAKWVETVQSMDPSLQVNLCTQLCAMPYKGTPPVVPGVAFGDVTREVAEWILTVYDHPELSVDFILQRVAAAPGVAAFLKGVPVGFFITHSDAELGPVYADPALRGTGLADALYAEMVSRLPADGPAPVLFVFPDNHASQKWLRRLGCVPAKEQVAWFWRE